MQNLNSTAERRAAYFRWHPQDEAISVDVHLNIFQLLERDVVRAGENCAAGLLLGRIEAGHLIVEGAEAATPETGAGESPFTNLEKIEPILGRWRRGNKRISTVGLYRSSGRGEAVLSKDDLAALRACTSAADVTGAHAKEQSTGSEERTEPDHEGSVQVLLLIGQGANQAVSTTLYLTRGGVVQHESSLVPFKRADLCKQQSSEKTNAPYAPSLPQDARNDFQERNPPPATAIQLKGATKWRWLLAPAGIVLLGGLLVLGNRQQLHLLTDSQKPTENHLGLKVQRSGKDWEVRWDQDAPILLTGSNGHLRITDGAIHKEIELAPSELRNGRIIYTPMTDDVGMELEVESPKSGKPSSEFVRIVAGLLPAQESQRTVPVRTRDFPNQTLPSSPIRIPTVPSAVAVASQHAPTDSTALSGEQTLPRTQAPTPMPQMSPERKTEDGHKSVETLAERPSEPAVSFAEPAALLGSPEMLAPLSSPPTPAGGKIEAAQLISRSDPIYPQLARQEQIAGNVEVNFKIGANGEVRDVTAKGPAMLTQAAVEAVQKWHYVPARLNGVSTETRATTVFTFRLK
jgi:protein TonB